jgi:hypothetical protein
MAPEQVNGIVTRATDIYAAGVVLWEMLTRKRLHHAENDLQTFSNIMAAKVEPPSTYAPEVTPELDAVVLQALRPDPGERFFSAREMARALQHAAPMASAPDVGDWVHAQASGQLLVRAKVIASMESSGILPSVPTLPPLSERSERGVATVTAPPSLVRSKSVWVLGGASLAVLVVGVVVGMRWMAPAPASRPVVDIDSPHVGLAGVRAGTADAPTATLAATAISDLPAMAMPSATSSKASDAAATPAATFARPRWSAAGAQPRTPAAEGTSDFSHVMDSRK